MSVRTEDGVIHLEGRCLAADAEELLTALREAEGAAVDLSNAQHLHLAVVQVLLALHPPLLGAPSDPLLASVLSRSGLSLSA